MIADFRERVALQPSTSVPVRLRHGFWRQAARSPLCPDGPRLEGRVALVTGGSRGVGLETSRGLAARGAEIIAASRDADNGEQVARAIQAAFGRPSHFVPLDLGDLAAVERSLDRLEPLLCGRQLDILVANAGLWPRSYARSPQGHEIAFATNVLGHHALIRGALDRRLLADRARVIVLTGDIYLMSRECTASYSYRGMLGGQMAYCRSKLGNLWYARELARRHPALRVHAVHPGVVASELGVSNAGMAGAVKRALMLSPERGAQVSLFCATQPDLESGTYYHNTLGRVELRPDDPGADDQKAGALWELVEGLVGSRTREPEGGEKA